jgi:MOSC domain-containing protein YiiM
MATPRVVSVNVGRPRTVNWAGRPVTSAIWKRPVVGRVVVEGVNLNGDDQADRRVHGGPDKAIYAYSAEDYAWWSTELAVHLEPGTFGENLTTDGMDLGGCVIGQRWHVGTAVLEVAQPREPCFKLGMRMGDAEFVDRFGASRRAGAYLRIVERGDIGAGDPIRVGTPPAHGLTVDDLVGVSPDASLELLQRIESIGDVPESWRALARRRLDRMRRRNRVTDELG